LARVQAFELIVSEAVLAEVGAVLARPRLAKWSGELARIAVLARKLYEANTHIFEDERDALTALGVSYEPTLLQPAA
jgi:hypothetical protein